MKKLIAFVLAFVCLFAITGCVSKSDAITSRTPAETTPNDTNPTQWGVTLEVDNVTASGLTMICTQSDGNPSGELQTGSDYVLEECIDGSWYKVEYIIDEYNVSWTAEARIIPMNDSVAWDFNWEYLYGELSAGEYRIAKDIMDYRNPGNYDIARGYVEFVIQ